MDPAAIAFAIAAAAAALLADLSARGLARMAGAYLRLAAVLAGALAAADLVAALLPAADAVADAVGLIVAALSPALMVVAAFLTERRRLPTAIEATILAAACCAGLVAAALAIAPIALVPLVFSATLMGALSMQMWKRARRPALLLALATAALFAAAAVWRDGGVSARIIFTLFLSTALVGVAVAMARRSDAAVERHPRRGAASVLIGGEH